MPLVRALDKENPTWTLIGDEYEPVDPEFRTSSSADQRVFWSAFARAVYKRKQEELSRGLDWYGRKLKPIKRSTVEQRAALYGPMAKGPPLMPQYETSRTRRLLSVRVVMGNRAVGYYPKRWGKILGYHARGEVRGAPKRDIFGLSRAGIRWAREQATKQWKTETLNRPKPVVLPKLVAEEDRPRAKTDRQTEAERLLAKYPWLAEFKLKDVVPEIETVEIPPDKPSLWRRALKRIKSLFGGIAKWFR